LVVALAQIVAFLGSGTSALASGNTITVVGGVDISGGGYSSLALDADGYPVISYYSNPNGNRNGDLKILHCGNPDCTADNTIASPDPAGGSRPSLQLDSAGNAVVSYTDGISGDLKVLRCGSDCMTGSTTISTVDTGEDARGSTSLALDGEDIPIVSYYESPLTDGNLKVLHCGNYDCTAGNSVSALDMAGPVGNYASVSIALDSSEIPVLAYYDRTNGDLKVLRCGTPDCKTGNTIAAPDTEGDVGSGASIALNSSGNPVVSYYDGTNQELKVLHCGNADCTSGNVISTLAKVDNLGSGGTAMVLDSHGNPVVFFSFLIYHCADSECTSKSVAGFSLGVVPLFPSLRLDDMDRPFVSYTGVRGNTYNLTLFRCGDPSCNAPSTGYGDINCDGKVTSEEALFLLQFSARLLQPDLNHLACFFPAGDVTRDGHIDAKDAVVILQYAAGLLPNLP